MTRIKKGKKKKKKKKKRNEFIEIILLYKVLYLGEGRTEGTVEGRKGEKAKRSVVESWNRVEMMENNNHDDTTVSWPCL